MTESRENIESKYKWNLGLMYENKELIDKDMKELLSLCEELKSFKSKLSDSVENFISALKVYEKASRIRGNLYVYSNMKHHEDTRINENQALSTKMEMLSTDFYVASSFISTEIIAMDENVLSKFLENEDLKFYKRFIDEIMRKKPYTLSEKEEEILAATSEMSNSPETTYEILSYSDMIFPEITDEEGNKVKIDHFNYSVFIRSKDRRVRKEAYEAMFSTFIKYKNTIASTLTGNIKSKIFYSKIRKYKSSIESALFEDNISLDVYNGLLKTVASNINYLDDYIELKK